VTESRRGLVHGIAAYVLWGIVPIYWKLMRGIGPVEILAHRVVWGMLACAAIVWASGAGPALRAALADRKVVAMMAVSGALLTLNWGTFVYAVVSDHLVDASVGYFINPLLSVVLGAAVLREPVSRLSWTALGLAAAGVALLTWHAGHLPWIAVVVSISFAGYGLVRKLARVEALVGSAIETALLAPLAAGYLAILAIRGSGELGHAGLAGHILVISTGVVTAVPLVMFSIAARRLPLSTLGFLQFLGPILQLVLAVALYGEPFVREQQIAFGLIWLGLAAFSIDLARRSALSRTGR
jgi:chloramphenicol-sensitive protein RarD